MLSPEGQHAGDMPICTSAGSDLTVEILNVNITLKKVNRIQCSTLTAPRLSSMPEATTTKQIPRVSRRDLPPAARSSSCAGLSYEDSQNRHGRACPGHPRLPSRPVVKTWMPGTGPDMTD
jgi:hypothetical protein